MTSNTEIIGQPSPVWVWEQDNGCENAEALASYSGWHLAAALSRVCTSGAHSPLKTLETTTHPLGVWATTFNENSVTSGLVLMPFGLFGG